MSTDSRHYLCKQGIRGDESAANLRVSVHGTYICAWQPVTDVKVCPQTRPKRFSAGRLAIATASAAPARMQAATARIRAPRLAFTGRGHHAGYGASRTFRRPDTGHREH